MIDDQLSRIFVNQWIVFMIVTVVLLALGEVGFRLGIVARRRTPDTAAGHGGSVQGAVLGLLGLLLGFSFAMAVGRYEARRNLTLEEANAIGTTWLRSELLPDQRELAVKKLLRRYTGLRLDLTATHDEAKFA